MNPKYSVHDTGPRIDQFLRRIVADAKFQLDFSIESGDGGNPDFENPDLLVKFHGRDVELLLANRAELLLALELVTQEFLRLHSDDHSRISFDANDYRALRIEELRLSALTAAEKVKRTHAPFYFNPMSSRERRVIHLALRDEKELRSESVGLGPARAVVVVPADMATPPAPPVAPRGFPGPRPGGRGGFDRGGGRPGGGPPGHGGGGHRGAGGNRPPRGGRGR